jgi:hypothetical protein
MRMRVSGADNSNNEYTRSRQVFDSTNTSFADNGSTGTSSFLLGQLQTTNGALNCVELFSPFLTQRTKHLTVITQPNAGLITSGQTTVTTSYTGFTLIAATAVTMSGTVSVYGYSK